MKQWLLIGAILWTYSAVFILGNSALILRDIQVRASKDARVFTRTLGNSDTFQSTGIIDESLLPSKISLALRDENIFIAVPFVLALTSSTVSSIDLNNTSVILQQIDWSVVINDVGFVQEAYSVEIKSADLVTLLNGDIDILTVNGLLVSTIPSDANPGGNGEYLKVDHKGTTEIKVFASAEIESTTFSYEVEISFFVITPFLSVFPLIMVVILALLSRNVYIALFFGIWIGSLVITGGDIPESFKQLLDVHLIPSVTSSTNFRTIIFTLFLGGLIAQISRSGGQEGFTIVVEKFATSPRLTQLSACIAGFGLFFDDYSCALILGASFKKITDKFYISREKLAYVVDSTAAPIASIAPISSWIAFEIGLIKDELDAIREAFNGTSLLPNAEDLPKEYPFFLNTIPNRFYPIFTIVLQFTLIISGVEFGPMLLAERRCRIGRRTDGGDGAVDKKIAQDLTAPDKDTPRRAWNFFFPLGFFLISLITSLVLIGRRTVAELNAALPADEQIPLIAREIFGNTDSFSALVYTTIGASLFTLIFYLIQFKEGGEIVLPGVYDLFKAVDCRVRDSDELAQEAVVELLEARKQHAEDVVRPRPLLYFTEGVNTWVEGFKNLIPSIIVLGMAFTIKSIVSGCGTDRFFADLIANSDVKAEALPTIIFIVAALISFCTGTSFGTMSIMFPLVSFGTFVKANGDIELFTVALSSIMSGAVFGDHASLISDTTILSSIGSGCKLTAHVITQLPYAFWAASFAILVGTLPVGYGASSGIMLVFGSLIMILVTIFTGAPIVASSGRLDVFSELLLKVTKSESLKHIKTQTRMFAFTNPDIIDPDPFDFVRMVWRLISMACSKKSKEDSAKPDTEDISSKDKGNNNINGSPANQNQNHNHDEEIAEV